MPALTLIRTVDIDPFPFASLQDRYNLGKQTVYNRLDALSIKIFKQGNKSYITAAEVELLDQLHEHISAGGKMDEFALPTSPQKNQPSRQNRHGKKKSGHTDRTTRLGIGRGGWAGERDRHNK